MQETICQALLKPVFSLYVCFCVSLRKMGDFVPIESLVYNNKLDAT